MKKKKKVPVRLIFTVALRSEIPIEWLRQKDIRVLTPAGLESGEAAHITTSIIFVITGVGPDASSRAAVAISATLSPCYVVNIGSAGRAESTTPLGQWVQPSSLRHENGEALPLTSPLPFSTPITTGGTLVTLPRPLLGDRPIAGDYVDMEAAAQAEVFSTQKIPFSCIKWISDAAGSDAVQEWEKNIATLRDEIKNLLAFVEYTIEPRNISVVIPVHNRADSIVTCIDSVLAQSVTPREIIIVDDGSDDDTVDTLATFGDAITIITLPHNQGVSAARNRGVAAATGDWIAFLDSDDSWTPDKLTQQIAFINRYPFYRIMQSEEVWIRNGVRVNQKKHHRKESGFIFESSLHLCLISPSSVLLQKSLLHDVGGFDEKLPACEDYDLWLRISRHHLVGLDATPSTIKQGGHSDQLSRRYEAMDQFRVTALQSALLREEDEIMRSTITAVLRRKLTILRDGSHKRKKNHDANHYQILLSEIG